MVIGAAFSIFSIKKINLDYCIYNLMVGTGKLPKWTDEEPEETAEAVGYGAIK